MSGLALRNGLRQTNYSPLGICIATGRTKGAEPFRLSQKRNPAANHQTSRPLPQDSESGHSHSSVFPNYTGVCFSRGRSRTNIKPQNNLYAPAFAPNR